MNDNSLSGTSVWVVDDDESIRWVLEKSLKAADFAPRGFPGVAELMDALEEDTPAALISDIRMPGVDGLELMARIRERLPKLPIIIITAHSDLDSAVAAYQGGAFEYLPKPFDVDQAIDLVRRAVRHHVADSAGGSGEVSMTANLVGEAPAMQEVFRAIGRLSHSEINVLITGESGTGKELVARALHEHSPRATKPFIAVNTAAIPRDLMESEFFGHERGAFTGAQTQRKGRFEQADGGTLFLDEIGDMPAELQTRLLRVLSDGQFYRVGGHTPISVDVRVIAATNQDLEKEVEEGNFREDLFHRLNVIRVRIPPLRERKSDVPLLLKHFMQRSARELKVEAKRLQPEVAAYLASLNWPGNVRQIENTCRWITVMAPSQEIHMEDLPTDLKTGDLRTTDPVADEHVPATASASQSGPPSADWLPALRLWARSRMSAGSRDLLGEALPQFERAMIEEALDKSAGHKQEAAKLLGWGRNTLTRKLKELGMS